MELQNTRKTGEYFTYIGKKAYKFSYNKFVTVAGEVFTVYKGNKPKRVCEGSGDPDSYIPIRYRVTPESSDISTTVHQVVARAFIENPQNYDVVDHKNENKADNRVENLRWTTLTGNIDFYNFKDDRAIQELKKQNMLLAEKNKKLNTQLLDIKVESAELKKLHSTLIDEVSKQMAKAKEDVLKFSKLNIPEEKFNEKVSDSTEKKFNKVEKAIKLVGKPIFVEDEEFDSIRAAARYLESLPESRASAETMRKELKKLVRGERGPWMYKDKYYIHL